MEAVLFAEGQGQGFSHRKWLNRVRIHYSVENPYLYFPINSKQYFFAFCL